MLAVWRRVALSWSSLRANRSSPFAFANGEVNAETPSIPQSLDLALDILHRTGLETRHRIGAVIR
ncbi:MAG TPA: hypothetical protein VF633_14800, partial [Brevundimonas sp.]